MLSSLYRAAARIRALFASRAFDQDLSSEIESHISLRTEDHLRRGVPPEEAERLARVEFGSVSQLREAHREIRGVPFVDTLLQDLRYALRLSRQNPGFTLFAVLIIGLGIGASSTVFSIVNSLLIRPLPFRDATRLVWISNLADDGISEWNTQVDNFLDLRAKNTSFSDLTGYFGHFEPGDTKLTEGGLTHRLSGLRVSQNFFPFLAVQPLLGRNFTGEECKPNGPGAALLSYGFWRRYYASDPTIVGRQITLNDQPVTIVGVAPSSFDFGTVFAPGNHIDVFLPMPLSEETNRWGNTLSIIGRLKPGITLPRARTELKILAARMQRLHPERQTFRPVLTSLDEHVTGHVRRPVIVLAWAVAIVMLTVCANIANLQLARSLGRQKEIAVRVAIGAGRRRLIRQMLTEGMVLSLCGAVFGLLLAFLVVRLLAGLTAFKLPLLSTVRMDPACLAFSLSLALISGLLFGLAPALQISLASVHDKLKDTTRSATGTRHHLWLRNTLVVSEIVLACVLLSGAGLLIRSFINVLQLNLGFQPERAAAFHIDHNYSSLEEKTKFCDRVLERVRTLPGIRAAALTDNLPLVGDRSWDIAAKGKLYQRGHYPEGFIRLVSDGYIRAMGIPLRAGREFTPRDTSTSEPVALVNETAARTLWPGQDPIGQLVIAEGGQHPARRVVGVVADVRHRSLEQGSGCELYIPLPQRDENTPLYLVVRTALPPAALAFSIRTALRPIAPGLSTDEFRTMQQVVDAAVSPRRFIVLLLSGFSAFALVLAALGIYAVISYSINQRQIELGIRMALGATVRELQGDVLLQALKLASLGMLMGGIAAWSVSRALASLLFGVTSTDPLTFFATVLVLTSIALVAAYLPAVRISKIEPQAALRGS
ncbi:MAG TPA: ABC transporter permease [Bryobacteraceae bacterium]|jgi:predicted permease|nr:ABC transporter permease [Bryobacteraceae bacterium]